MSEGRSKTRFILGSSAGTRNAVLVVALEDDLMRVADAADANKYVVKRVISTIRGAKVSVLLVWRAETALGASTDACCGGAEYRFDWRIVPDECVVIVSRPPGAVAAATRSTALERLVRVGGITLSDAFSREVKQSIMRIDERLLFSRESCHASGEFRVRAQRWIVGNAGGCTWGTPENESVLRNCVIDIVLL